MDATHPESEQPARHIAKQLEICLELTNLAMQNARATTARALREAEEEGTPPSRRRLADPSLAFVRISREIRQLTELAIRLAASQDAAQPVTQAVTGAAEPPAPRPPAPVARIPRISARARAPRPRESRRPALYKAVDILTEHHPNRDECRARLIIDIEGRLAADRRYTIPAALILLDAAEKLGMNAEDTLFPPELYEELLPQRFRRQAPPPPSAQPDIQIAA